MSKQPDMDIVMRNPAELIPAEYNPRQLTEDQFEQIKASLDTFGFVDPVIVNQHPDRAGIIIGGHQRVRVAMALKMDGVPTVNVSLTYEQERELNVRLNKATGDWDWDALANHFDMDELCEWGFTEQELTALDIDGQGQGDDEIDPDGYYVKVDVDSEGEQRKLYEMLTKHGYEVKAGAR